MTPTDIRFLGGAVISETVPELALRIEHKFPVYRGNELVDRADDQYLTMGLDRRTFLGAAATAGFGVVGVASAQRDHTVEMVTEGDDYYFDPIGLYVEPGTTVTFEISSGSHSATAYHLDNPGASERRIPDDASAWNSGTLSQQGTTWEHTFETTGTHDYYCIPHKTLGMVGRIVVGEPGGPAEGSIPPDGNVPESRTIVEQGVVSYDAFVSGGAGEEKSRSWVVGAGLLGGMAALAAGVYRVVNSEGERYQVGSADWKRRYGLE